MSPKMSRLMWGTLLGSCLIATFALSPSRAQNRVSVSPDKLVPKDTLLLVRWDGTAAHAEAFSETAAHEALYESGLVPLLEKAIKGLAEQAGPGPAGGILDGPAGQALGHIKDNGATLAVALAAPGPDGPPIPLPYAVLVFPQAAQFAGPLGQLLQQNGHLEVESQEIDGREISSFLVPDAPGIEVGWWVEGEHLVVAAGMNALPTAIAVASGELPNITANPLWKEFGPESVDFEMTGLSWLDLGNIREAYGEMPVPIPMAGPDGQPFTVNQIAKVAGLDNVGAAVSQSGYKGKALWSETVLQVDGEKRGLLALSDHKPITLEQLPPLPADTMTFAAGSFSLSKFYTDLLSIVNDAAKLGPPEIGQQVQQGIEAAPQILGFDPKTDLFDTLGNVTALYLDSSQDFLGFGGVAAIMEVKDAEKLQKTLNHMLLMGEAAAGGEFTVVRSEKYGRQIISFEVEGVEFGGLTVDENWVILGLMPQTVEVALLRIDGKLDHFVPSRELQAALAGMPKEFTSIAVSNPRQTYKTLMGYAPLLFSAGKAGLRNSGMFPPDLEIPVALADIPPSEVVIRPLFPNVMVGESTAQGFRWTSRNSLPSLPFAGDVGGVGSVGTIGVLTALLLPAVQQAREAARRSQSKNNMKQIMLAMHNYHEVYRSFPAGTIEDSAEDPDDRLSWLVSILPFADQAPLYEQIDRKSAWDSDANSEWTSFDINTFLNPSNPNIGEGSTHYIGMAGIGEDAAELEVDHARAGVFGYDRKTRIRDIKDGTSNTIAITGASDDIGPWAKGGRSTFRGLTEEPYINGPDGIGGPHQGGMHAGFADGSVRFISENIDQDLFKKLITINGGEPVRGPF